MVVLALQALEPVIPFDDIGAHQRSVCAHHLMTPAFCPETCSVTAPNADWIIAVWGIPPLPVNITPERRLARFLAMTRKIPYVVLERENMINPPVAKRIPDWDVYLSTHLPTLLPAFSRARPQIIQIIADTNPNIYTTKEDVPVLMALRKKGGVKKAMPDQLREAAVHAGKLFGSLEWSKMTRFQVFLVLNALRKREEDGDGWVMDEDLQVVKDTAEYLVKWFNFWTDENDGWHIAMER